MQKVHVIFTVKPGMVFDLKLKMEEVLFLSKFDGGGTSCKPSELEGLREKIKRLLILNVIKIKKGAQIVYFELTLIGKKLINSLEELN